MWSEYAGANCRLGPWLSGAVALFGHLYPREALVSICLHFGIDAALFNNSANAQQDRRTTAISLGSSKDARRAAQCMACKAVHWAD
jgi:hypothetical protein